MDQELLQRLHVLHRRVQSVLNRLDKLEGENASLRQRVASLQADKQQLQDRLKTVEDEKKNLAIATQIRRDPASSRSMQLKLNEYINEINRCIELLQEQQ
jgi:predicted nuclease with TOPRIM domain